MIFLAAQPIVGILEEHVEELGSLLERRAQAVRSPDYRPRDVRLLDARIVAHADALVVAGRDAQPLLVDVLEGAEDPALVAGAAFALVQTEDPKIDLRPIGERLSAAPPEVIRAIGEAWLLARPGCARDALVAMVRGAPPRVAAVATLALVGAADASVAQRLPALLADGDPVIRQAGWAALAALTWGGRPRDGLPRTATWAVALRADCEAGDPEVRDAALVAAVMTRETFLLPFALDRATAGSRADLSVADLGAALSEPRDLSVFVRMLQRPELGLGRFAVAASCGAPGIVEPLIAAMASPEPGVVLAAPAAFRRITGLEVAAGGAMLRVPPDWADDPVDVDEDRLEEVPRPDANRHARNGRRLHPVTSRTPHGSASVCLCPRPAWSRRGAGPWTCAPSGKICCASAIAAPPRRHTRTSGIRCAH